MGDAAPRLERLTVREAAAYLGVSRSWLARRPPPWCQAIVLQCMSVQIGDEAISAHTLGTAGGAA